MQSLHTWSNSQFKSLSQVSDLPSQTFGETRMCDSVPDSVLVFTVKWSHK